MDNQYGNNGILNTTIKWNDGNEFDPRPADEVFATHGYATTLDVVIPEQAINMKKCIVLMDTLMAQIMTLHGIVCLWVNCVRAKHYKKIYFCTRLVVSRGFNSCNVGGR